MAESVSLEALSLPDWNVAVKYITVGKAASQQNSRSLLEGSYRSFMDGAGLLVELYRQYGSSVASEEIKRLVDAFTNQIVQMFNKTSEESGDNSLLKIADLSCPICFEVVEEPYTVICGHSYCKRCLHKEVVGNQCRLCSHRFNSGDLVDTRPNVLLLSLVDKLWPNHKKTASFRSEGNELFKKNKLEEALQKYNQALELCSNDHLALCNRAHTQLIFGDNAKALEDADLAISYCPYWFKSYFRKSTALINLGRYEDAFCTLAICIYIVKVTRAPTETSATLVKHEMMKIMLKVLSSTYTTNQLSQRRRTSDTLSFLPYPDQKRKCCRNRHGAQAWTEPSAPLEPCSCSVGEDVGDSLSPLSSSRSGGSLKELSSLHHTKSRMVQSHGTITEPVIVRLHHILSLALSEVEAFENRVPNNVRSIDESLVSVLDVECSLCYRLMYQSVTTKCGHTYCRSCLERSMDHSPTCPLCKTSLDCSVTYRRHAITYTLEQLISRIFPKEHADRVNQHLEELADGCTSGQNKELEIPIFVCTMAFPTIPCMLHVFEPRYRLMIRRCMESGSKRFGMCCYLQDGDHNYGDYGTILEVRNIQYFPDGRSVVNTVGARRFKVLRKSMKDGYNSACIEYLDDRVIEESEKPRLRETHESVFRDANEWILSIDQVIRQRIITHFGNMPSPEEDWISVVGGPSWTWWLLAILPLDAKAQLAILSMNSLQKRLESLQKVLRYVKGKLR